MSGYLEVKYPFKSNIGLNPFKSWKRQWCILRPGPSAGGGSLAVYCSEAGASAGTVELRSGCVVKRAKSRTRPHAFAVFSVEEPCKPRILLAAQTLQEAQQWMDKIRELLNGQKLLGTETLLKDSYSVTIVPTELSQLCGMVGDVTLTLSSSGLLLARPPTTALLRWQNITDVLQERENGDRNKTCILSIDSGFHGGGEMKLTTALNSELTSAVKLALKESARGAARTRSQPDLSAGCPLTAGELRRSSWYSGPSEVSFDDSDLTKEARRIACGQLSRSSGRILHASLTSLDDSMCDRRSLVSVASGVYEEISEEPRPRVLEEPTYESVADCIYATMRRTGKRHPPPPLPPRHPYHTMKLGESWSCRMQGAADAGVTRHSSLGSLHHKPARPAKPFSVFRKRLKSDSRIVTSPKSDTSKDNKDVETKKKKFDFTPTRDIFKSFKVSRKMKSLKLNSGLSKGETKSCEFLDETKHVTSNRCSKSVECLEGNDGYDEFDGNISLEVSAEPSVDFVPQELFQLILCPDLSKVRLKDPPCLCESEYMPMSPIVPPPIEQHYMVMSPRTNQA